jgi:hypothetical protein
VNNEVPEVAGGAMTEPPDLLESPEPLGSSHPPEAPQTPEAPNPPDAAGPPGSVERRVSIALAVALGALAVVPLVVALVASAGRSWVPTGDWAMIELATGDVGTRLTPLLGPYSRFGWNHPGPLLFWVLAGPYRLTGGAPWSMLATAAAVNAVAAGAMVAFAWRVGRLVPAALVALVALGVTTASSATMAADPWNPWITVLPFGLMIVLAWAAWECDRAAVWWGVVTGSFLAQSHVGYIPLVGAVVLVGVVGAWRGGMRRTTLRNAAVLGVVLWLPPLIDLVAGRGNLLDLVPGASGGDDATGGGSALELVARQLSWGGPWMGGTEPSDPVTGGVVGSDVAALAIPVALFGWALSLALWRRCRGPARLQMTVLAAAVVGVVAVARIDGPAFDYIVRWWWPLAGLWWASSLWSLWEALVRPALEPRLARWLGRRAEATLAGAVAAVVLVASLPAMTGAIAFAVDRPDPAARFVEVARELNDAILGELEQLAASGDRPLVVVHRLGGLSGWYADALGVRLQAAGWDVRAPVGGVNAGKWGGARLVPAVPPDPDDPGRVDVWVVSGPDVERPPLALARALAPTGVVVAYERDPLDAGQRDQRTLVEALVLSQLEAAGRSDLVRDYLDGESVLAARSVAGVDVDLLDQLSRTREASDELRVYVVR